MQISNNQNSTQSLHLITTTKLWRRADRFRSTRRASGTKLGPARTRSTGRARRTIRRWRGRRGLLHTTCSLRKVKWKHLWEAVSSGSKPKLMIFVTIYNVCVIYIVSCWLFLLFFSLWLYGSKNRFFVCWEYFFLNENMGFHKGFKNQEWYIEQYYGDN